MTDLVDTTEMYLRTILDLEEEHIVPLRARISERLGHSGPTVSQTIGRMERDGLVVVEGDRHLVLTADGRRRALHVMRKHRLAECLLTEVIGLDWDKVHDEACRWEHVISVDVEKRLVEILDSPTFSPYGNPIPGLKELGVQTDHHPFRQGAEPLADVVATDVRPFMLRRMSENIQADAEILSELAAAGLRPGVRFEAARNAEGVQVTIGERVLDLTPFAAELLFVEAVA